MLAYVIRRLILLPITLFGITALVFFMLALSPGGIGGPILKGESMKLNANDQQVHDYLEKRYHLKDPAWKQYVRWLKQICPIGRVPKESKYRIGPYGLMPPDLGEAIGFGNKPVGDLIAERLPVTLLINFLSFPFVYLAGIRIGLKAGAKPGGAYDRVTNAVQLATWSIPVIWVGTMMIGYLCNRDYLYWFPTAGLHETGEQVRLFLPRFETGAGALLRAPALLLVLSLAAIVVAMMRQKQWLKIFGMAAGAVSLVYFTREFIVVTENGWFVRGWLVDMLWHVLLPVICLSYGSSAFLTKLTRGSLLDVLSEDYVRTARAKGLRESVVVYRHAFRNATLPLITVAASIIPGLIGGSVIVESIFSIPGMGKLAVEAVNNRDRDVLLAVTLIGGILTLVSAVLRDVCYAVADPRVTYD